MTDMTTSFAGAGAQSITKPKALPYKLEDTHWGYTVMTNTGAARGLIIAQTISMLLGAAFLAGAIGMWVVPGLDLGADAVQMRLFSSIFFIALAALFLWYGTRGVLSQIHFDTARGEIREVTRTRSGRLFLIGCYGFDTVSGIAIEPAEDADTHALVLRYRSSGDPLIVATGAESDLIDLRDRISSDVVLGSNAALDATVQGEA